MGLKDFRKKYSSSGQPAVATATHWVNSGNYSSGRRTFVSISTCRRVMVSRLHRSFGLWAGRIRAACCAFRTGLCCSGGSSLLPVFGSRCILRPIRVPFSRLRVLSVFVMVT